MLGGGGVLSLLFFSFMFSVEEGQPVSGSYGTCSDLLNRHSVSTSQTSLEIVLAYCSILTGKHKVKVQYMITSL